MADYYGNAVLKPPVWKQDIAYYFFLGGLAAGSSVLGAGASATGRPALRRGCRLGAVGALGGGTYFLIADLGRPERFHHMLRVAKLISPMSVGTWILSVFGPLAGAAAASELLPGRLRRTPAGRIALHGGRAAGVAAAVVAPAVASYTAVLIGDTAVPAWNEAGDLMPFVFTASAAASAGGLGMLVAPVAEAAPARRFAQFGSAVELVASRVLERRGGPMEAYRSGRARKYLTIARSFTAAGALGSLTLGRRNRVFAAVSGACLLAGGLFERLGIFEAGVASAKQTRS